MGRHVGMDFFSKTGLAPEREAVVRAALAAAL